ncbi:MAG: hypothetical protein R2730_05875 [Chitinophagales bacterium]
MNINYKKAILPILMIAVISMFCFIPACKKKKTAQPDFKAIVNLQMDDISKNKFDLNGDIILVNNTDENFKAIKVIADIMIDKADVATYLDRKPMPLHKGRELVIPFKVTLDQNDLIGVDPMDMTVRFEMKGKVEFENDRKEIVTVKIADQQKLLLKDKKLKKATKRELRKLKKQLKKNQPTDVSPEN